MSHTTLVRTVLAALVLYQGLCWAQADSGAAQGSSDWLSKQYGYVANDESLRSLLYDFGTTLGVPVIVSTKISIIADDRIPVMSAEEFLSELHKRFGLIWVYDGTTLYVYDRAEAVRETLDFPFVLRDDVRNSLDASGVRGVPLNLQFHPTQNSLQISGPPRFVEWGKDIAQELISQAQEDDLAPRTSERAAQTPAAHVARTPEPAAPPGEDLDYVIRIFEVQYGYVDQMANSASGGKAPIVSLAEMVAKLMNVAHISGVSRVSSRGEAGVPKLRGTGVVGGDAARSQTQAALPDVVGTRGAGQEAFVIGDPRLNAVIVRDRKHRMPAYERLITELDSPVDQIEITVSVLDIDASAAEELRFELQSDSFQLNVGDGDGGSNITYTRNLWDIEGIALRVRALRNSGKSRILTTPSVTTLDNHEASFQNNRTFYVRLGGNDAESVDLAPVSYGWVVRIRPHVIYDGDDQSVQLAIHIEDGNRGGADLAVTGVPEVSQNVIQTQAVVPEGSSLLIGGYTVREQTRFEQRVPVLGRIPILGRLFSSQVDRDQSVARYFLITPRILPATISYEINTGFEGEPLTDTDSVRVVQDATEPVRTGQAVQDATEPVRTGQAMQVATEPEPIGTAVPAATEPEPARSTSPLHIGMDNVEAIRAAQAAAEPERAGTSR